MRPPKIITFVVMVITSIPVFRTVAAEPRVTKEGYTLELVAADPQIVTPVGVAFDKQGRLLVVESHTHLPKRITKGWQVTVFACSPIPTAMESSTNGARLPRAFVTR